MAGHMSLREVPGRSRAHLHREGCRRLGSAHGGVALWLSIVLSAQVVMRCPVAAMCVPKPPLKRVRPRRLSHMKPLAPAISRRSHSQPFRLLASGVMEDEVAIVRALAGPTHVHVRVRQQCSQPDEKAHGDATGLAPVPHDGVVFADETPSGTVITHMLTCEKMTMPSSGWTLSFDHDGFAAVLPPEEGPHAEDEPLLLEDALRFQLHKATDGGLFILGLAGNEQVDLGSLMQRWEGKDLIVRLHLVHEEPLHRAQLPAVQWAAMALGRLRLATVAEDVGPGISVERACGSFWPKQGHIGRL